MMNLFSTNNMKTIAWISVLLGALHGGITLAAQTDSPAVQQALADPAAAALARPTPGQVDWADMEVEMFVHFGVATWKGQEYDGDGRRF